jgi:large subunit ribosomal protein L30
LEDGVAKKKSKLIRVTQVRSGIGRQDKHRRTLRALGLKRHQQSVVHQDTPAIQGMIRQVSFLVDVTEVEA